MLANEMPFVSFSKRMSELERRWLMSTALVDFGQAEALPLPVTETPFTASPVRWIIST